MVTWFSWFIDSKKIIPKQYISSVHEVDYTKLYDGGKRLILTDLDNTLISYKETEPTKELYDLKDKLISIGFEIIIISNSHKARVSRFANLLNVNYVSFSKKPLKTGYKKGMKKASKKYLKEEIIFFGDQLMTDVYGACRTGLDAVLVKPIDKKTEIWITRQNRKLEMKMLKKAKRKHPSSYEEKLAKYVGENFDQKL